MSDIGYRNKNQATVSVSVNSLDEYVRDLSRAISTPYPPYEKIGVKVDGEYLQLNANILQIENEYYSFIRPKRIARSGERPTKALRRAGVSTWKCGHSTSARSIRSASIRTSCASSRRFSRCACCATASRSVAASRKPSDENHLRVARRGREPGLKLNREGREIPMSEWAGELLDSMQGMCEMLDHGEPARPYAAALGTAARQDRRRRAYAFGAPAHGDAQTGESFFQLARRMSKMHKDYFLDLYPPNERRLAEFAGAAQESHEEQSRIEAADKRTSTPISRIILPTESGVRIDAVRAEAA